MNSASDEKKTKRSQGEENIVKKPAKKEKPQKQEKKTKNIQKKENVKKEKQVEPKKPQDSVNKEKQINPKQSENVQNGVNKGTTVPEIPDDLKPTLKELLKRSFESDDQPHCEKGFFKLEGMSQCRKWLTCDKINDENVLLKVKKIGGGIGKLVYSGLLNGNHEVAIVYSRKPSLPRLSKRTIIGNQNLVMMQPSPYIIQVVGHCEQPPNSTIITESCSHCMDLWKLRKRNKSFHKFGDKQRFEWVTKIVGGFDYLHHGMKLPRVHCDLHTAEEALTQYLVSEDGKLFLADVDEIPEVDEKNGVYAKCLEETNGKMKTPDFIAPEQHYTVREYKAQKSKKPITEKSDIWKIPDIAKIILRGAKKQKDLFEKLEDIHSKCKNLDPKLRPTAREVFIEYLKVLKDVFD